ncbi:uncharacterized protein EI97DRAFT_440909 [Westerdykella ornata]|uniref:Uncharacterized protein n=1 Tax=Westerdykella ornata TaxID=318751 RepID=A0A6A6JP93_WESOR|nr:uncharacterized protein EI97DRAFT_440909 [Westerdykella ornata]KAF2278441.1 hypothetical protein EI97DRAFT_440909 [Westerdykella ornata]
MVLRSHYLTWWKRRKGSPEYLSYPALKGMTVDIPLALTEGLKNVPRHYGDTPRDHGPVTGLKSGATVTGKTFAWGFIDGVSDIVVKPNQGAQKEGMKGAVKGLG